MIYRYSREDAIRDGVLVDITELAKESGFKFPTAITNTVYEKHLNSEDEDVTTARIHDTLWMLYVAIKQEKNPSDRILFELYYGKELVKLKAIIGPGDTPAPVLTIMLPEED